MLNAIIVAVVAVSAVWVYLDATKNKIGKIPDGKGMFNMSAGAWGTVTLLLWLIGFPAYLIKRSNLIEKAKENPIEVKGRSAKVAVLSILGGLWFLMSLGANISDSPEITMVKSGTLQLCPNSTVEKMVNGFMGSPSWESGVTDNGVNFVNVGGDITLQNKPVRAVVQFVVDKAQGSFNYQAFEINEVPQNQIMALGLIKKMCESASN